MLGLINCTTKVQSHLFPPIKEKKENLKKNIYIQHVQNVFANVNGWWVPMIRTFLKNQKSENRMHWKSPLKDKAHLSPLKYKGTPPTHLSGVTDCTRRFCKCPGLHSTMEQAGYAMSLVGSLAVLLGRVSRSMYVHLNAQRSLNLLRGVICLLCPKKNWSSCSGCIQCILNWKKWSTN
jgi:hypothetical protein